MLSIRSLFRVLKSGLGFRVEHDHANDSAAPKICAHVSDEASEWNRKSLEHAAQMRAQIRRSPKRANTESDES